MVVLGTSLRSQLTLLFKARVKRSGKREKIFARVNSNCPLNWRGFKRGWLRDVIPSSSFFPSALSFVVLKSIYKYTKLCMK